MKRKKQTSEKETVLTTEKKLRNVRTCLYVLILAAITKIAMTDFYEVSSRPWLNVISMFLIIFLVLAVEKGLRKKLKEEKEKDEEIWE